MKKEKPEKLREKIIEILKKDIKIIGWSDTKIELVEKLYSNIADQILSKIAGEIEREKKRLWKEKTEFGDGEEIGGYRKGLSKAQEIIKK